jgi:hypothetical protein
MPPDVVSQLTQLAHLSPVAVPIGVAVLASLLVLAILVRRPPRYERQERLLSAAEWAFFQALEDAIGAQYRVFVKVRIADVLRPRTSFNQRTWWRAFTKVSSKHVDFVLVERATGVIAAALELDDATHDRQDRRVRDRFVNQAFAQAGVPLIRVKAGRGYRPRELSARISQAIAATA